MQCRITLEDRIVILPLVSFGFWKGRLCSDTNYAPIKTYRVCVSADCVVVAPNRMAASQVVGARGRHRPSKKLEHVQSLEVNTLQGQFHRGDLQ